MSEMTPREIVSELDKHIIGQDAPSVLLLSPCVTAGAGCSLTKSCVMKSRRKTF